jgi:hypothetical protein
VFILGPVSAVRTVSISISHQSLLIDTIFRQFLSGEKVPLSFSTNANTGVDILGEIHDNP